MSIGRAVKRTPMSESTSKISESTSKTVVEAKGLAEHHDVAGIKPFGRIAGIRKIDDQMVQHVRRGASGTEGPFSVRHRSSAARPGRHQCVLMTQPRRSGRVASDMAAAP